MSDDELVRLARASTAVTFGVGEVIASYGARTRGDVWIVRSGQVQLRAGDGTPIESVGLGDLFGYTPLLTDGGIEFSALATVPSVVVRLPDDTVRAQFAKPAGLAFLATSAWQAAAAERPTIAPATDNRPVSELVHGNVLLVPPDTSVRDAVVAMTDHHVSYALVRCPDGTLGIFTDRDLRTRVVAAGRPVDVAISEVMSAPARTVPADLTAETILMEMLDCGLRHMPVVTPRGEVVGVLEDADLLAASARRSFTLRRAIGQAADATELCEVGKQVAGLPADLFRNGTKASATSAILSVVIDAMVRKALQLALAEAPGAPHDGFAWLLLGSVARREAMPSSDVDSALSWAPDLAASAAELRAVAGRTHALLSACGLPSDTNGAVASSANFARSRDDWFEAARQWLDDPLRDRGVILSSLLLDGRVIWGDAALHTVPAAYRRMRVDHPNALRLQLLNALSDRVRGWSLRDVLSRRGGTFDLKLHAVTPIVNLARWGGLAADVTSASTPARLVAAAEAGAVTERDTGILTDVFVMVQRLRMTHQVEQVTAGHVPGDVITMAELSPLNRSLLGDGLREIAAVQRRVRNATTWQR